jgi:hypothetical protein
MCDVRVRAQPTRKRLRMDVIFGSVRRLGVGRGNQVVGCGARAKMLVGQWRQDLVGLERKLRNQLDERPQDAKWPDGNPVPARARNGHRQPRLAD